MKSKRFAQYVCAAILAFGFGLNIQNALTGYGISDGSTSITAGDGSNSGSNGSANGSTNGSSNGSSNGNSNGNSNGDNDSESNKTEGWYCQQGGLKEKKTTRLRLSVEGAAEGGWLQVIGIPVDVNGEYLYEKEECIYHYDCAPHVDCPLTYYECLSNCSDH